MNNIYIIGGAVALAGSVYYMNRKKNIIPETGGTGGGTGTISGGGGQYIDPAWTAPDNAVTDETVIPNTNGAGGSVTINEDEIYIVGGAFGQDQHFYAGSIEYDIFVTYYRGGKDIYANFSYTEQAVRKFYYSVANYGTDNAVTHMSGQEKTWWTALNKYCPFTYLPTAEAQFKIDVESGAANPDIEAAYIAAIAAKKELNNFIKAGTYTDTLNQYEAGRISQSAYNAILKQYQDLQKAFSDALHYYYSIGGTAVIN